MTATLSPTDVGTPGVVAPPRAHEGVVDALMAVTGVRDDVDDIIVPGAFARTLRERPFPRVCLGHDWNRPIGQTIAVKELLPGDPALPKTTADGRPWPAEAGALWARVRYNLDTEDGRKAFADALFAEKKSSYSIGYRTRKARRADGIRHLHDVDLYEYSQVTVPAMPLATLQSIKSMSGLSDRESPVSLDDMETKARRYVRNTEFWGLPLGTLILPGMKPRGPKARALARAGKPVPENAGTVEIDPNKTLSIKPTAKGKAKDGPPTRDRPSYHASMFAIQHLVNAIADAAQSSDSVNFIANDPNGEVGKKDEEVDALDLLIANAIVPSELRDNLERADYATGSVADADADNIAARALIPDVIDDYRERYQAELVLQRGKGQADDVPDLDDDEEDGGAPATQADDTFAEEGAPSGAEPRATQDPTALSDDELTAALERARGRQRELVAARVPANRPSRVDAKTEIRRLEDEQRRRAAGSSSLATILALRPYNSGERGKRGVLDSQRDAIRALGPEGRDKLRAEINAELDTLDRSGNDAGNVSRYNNLVELLAEAEREPGQNAVDELVAARSRADRAEIMGELDTADLRVAARENDDALALLRRRNRPAEKTEITKRERVAAELAAALDDAPQPIDLDAPTAQPPGDTPTPATEDAPSSGDLGISRLPTDSIVGLAKFASPDDQATALNVLTVLNPRSSQADRATAIGRLTDGGHSDVLRRMAMAWPGVPPNTRAEFDGPAAEDSIRRVESGDPTHPLNAVGRVVTVSGHSKRASGARTDDGAVGWDNWQRTGRVVSVTPAMYGKGDDRRPVYIVHVEDPEPGGRNTLLPENILVPARDARVAEPSGAGPEPDAPEVTAAESEDRPNETALPAVRAPGPALSYQQESALRNARPGRITVRAADLSQSIEDGLVTTAHANAAWPLIRAGLLREGVENGTYLLTPEGERVRDTLGDDPDPDRQPDRSTAAMWRRDPTAARARLTPHRQDQYDVLDRAGRIAYARRRAEGDDHATALTGTSAPEAPASTEGAPDRLTPEQARDLTDATLIESIAYHEREIPTAERFADRDDGELRDKLRADLATLEVERTRRAAPPADDAPALGDAPEPGAYREPDADGMYAVDRQRGRFALGSLGGERAEIRPLAEVPDDFPTAAEVWRYEEPDRIRVTVYREKDRFAAGARSGKPRPWSWVVHRLDADGNQVGAGIVSKGKFATFSRARASVDDQLHRAGIGPRDTAPPAPNPTVATRPYEILVTPTRARPVARVRYRDAEYDVAFDRVNEIVTVTNPAGVTTTAEIGPDRDGVVGQEIAIRDALARAADQARDTEAPEAPAIDTEATRAENTLDSARLRVLDDTAADTSEPQLPQVPEVAEPEPAPPAPDTRIADADLAEVEAIRDAAYGLIEAEDGELEVDDDVAARQDRVAALLDADKSGALDVHTLPTDELRRDRADLADELRLQEEVARRDARRRRDTKPTSAPTPTAPVTADEQPEKPKTRPGLAGAAQDYAEALESGDPAAIERTRARLDSSLRRSRAGSDAGRALAEAMRDGTDPDELNRYAAALRAETRERRNTAARKRRLVRRLERERIRSLIGSIDAELRTRGEDDRTGTGEDDGSVVAVATPTGGGADVGTPPIGEAPDETPAPAVDPDRRGPELAASLRESPWMLIDSGMIEGHDADLKREAALKHFGPLAERYAPELERASAADLDEGLARLRDLAPEYPELANAGQLLSWYIAQKLPDQRKRAFLKNLRDATNGYNRDLSIARRTNSRVAESTLPRVADVAPGRAGHGGRLDVFAPRPMALRPLGTSPFETLDDALGWLESQPDGSPDQVATIRAAGPQAFLSPGGGLIAYRGKAKNSQGRVVWNVVHSVSGRHVAYMDTDDRLDAGPGKFDGDRPPAQFDLDAPAMRRVVDALERLTSAHGQQIDWTKPEDEVVAQVRAWQDISGDGTLHPPGSRRIDGGATGLLGEAILTGIGDEVRKYAGTNAFGTATYRVSPRGGLVNGREGSRGLEESLSILEADLNFGRRRDQYDDRTPEEMREDKETGRIVAEATAKAFGGRPHEAVQLLNARAAEVAWNRNRANWLRGMADQVAELFSPVMPEPQRIHELREGDHVASTTGAGKPRVWTLLESPEESEDRNAFTYIKVRRDDGAEGRMRIMRGSGASRSYALDVRYSTVRDRGDSLGTSALNSWATFPAGKAPTTDDEVIERSRLPLRAFELEGADRGGTVVTEEMVYGPGGWRGQS